MSAGLGRISYPTAPAVISVDPGGADDGADTTTLRVHLGALGAAADSVSVRLGKTSTAEDVVRAVVCQLRLGHGDNYELAETFSCAGRPCKERRLEAAESPARVQSVWPIVSPLVAEHHGAEYRFQLVRRDPDRPSGIWIESPAPAAPDRGTADALLADFLRSDRARDCADLCQLPTLNENTLLENLRRRFAAGDIYTYVGSILISVNPFRFFPIYNPKYVKLYQNRRLGELPPHVFALADAAYHAMLRDRRNQCIVISGESGSGKTECTNLLLHHLSALSQKGYYGNGIEQTILGAGPVLEAFGNAKTVHNNNSSRFGKFIQVFYKENGMIHGAVVEKYLLEKSRIVSQSKNERNYHVFYYLLSGGGQFERETLGLREPQDYFYLNQSECYTLETLDGERVDEANELTTLQQSMDMVGFSTDIQRRIFSVLAAVLHLGNVSFKKKTDHAHHEAVQVQNIDLVNLISGLLKVKEITMLEALTKKKTMAGGETVVMNYKMADAIATRDAMAKCLYGALFDWIVLHINHAILAKQEYNEHQGNSIGVLDIFGFEDFEKNSFEQFCINYANEHLHYYFNQHIFKFEQEEYIREGIQWKNIEFMDNSGCLELFSSRPRGLLCLLDEECNFPGATNETLLNKFHTQHASNSYYEVPQMRESAFIINHYAGRVKYHIKDFREKNSDLMRNDVVLLLKNSNLTFVRELVGNDPVAVMHWAIVRAFFRAYFAFRSAGKTHQKRAGGAEKESPAKMSRMGSVKKLKERWDQNVSEFGTTGTGELNFLNKKTVLNTQSYLDLFRQGRKSHPPAQGSSSAPCTPVVAPSAVEPVLASMGQTSGSQNVKLTLAKCQSDYHIEDSKSKSVKYDQSDESTCLESSVLCSQDLAGQSSDSINELAVEWNGPVADENMILLHESSKCQMKNRSFKPWSRTTRLRDLKLMKTLAGKRVVGPRPSKGKNKPPSVSAQFNYSLQQLMETLSQANPFFIRCIKSNADKAPCVFDDELVLRQLRYTGMLATVKIRQSGYNYRLTTQEFLHQYKVLLPNGLLSSKQDIHDFLLQCDQNQENFQIGNTKVFLRETDKLILDEMLNSAIMEKVMSIQRWLKMRLERKHFLKMRKASVVIQSSVRRFLAQRHVQLLRQVYATVMIQSMFRRYRQRKAFKAKKEAAVILQKHIRGYLARKRFKAMLSDVNNTAAEKLKDLNLPQNLPQAPSSVPLARFRQISGHDISSGIQQVCDKQHLADLPSPGREAICDISDRIDAQKQARSHSEGENDSGHSSTLKMATLQGNSQRDDGPEVRTAKVVMHRCSEHKPKGYRTEERAKGECHDLYSSASDEGILSKELSSEEFLADKTDADVTKELESEGSSGILEDSEADSNQHEAIKSRETSSSPLPGTAPASPFTQTPPSITSTPDHRWERVPSVPFEDVVEFPYPTCLRRSISHQSAEKPRAHSVAVLQGAAQQPGPRDLELHVVPVTKAVSEEFLQTYESNTYKVTSLPSPNVTAPIAKPETFSEFEGSLLENSLSLKKKQPSLSSLMTSDAGSLSSQGGITNRNPFHKARRQFKQFVTGGKKKKDGTAYDSDDSQTEDAQSMYSEKSDTIKPKDNAANDDNDGSQSKQKLRRRNSKKKRSHKVKVKVTKTATSETVQTVGTGTWTVSSTSEWQYPTDRIVSSWIELRQLEDFVRCKLIRLEKGEKETIFDQVFNGALKEFQHNLLTQISVTQQHTVSLSYKDLMISFEEILKAHTKAEKTNEEFPVILGINAFRGFLNEFNKRKENKELPEIKYKKEKKKRDKAKDKEILIEHNGHRYEQAQFSIHTYCEFCSSLIWLLEKAFVCRVCRYTVHKKCYSKSSTKCSWYRAPTNTKGARVFGVPLPALLGPGDSIPSILEHLFSTIELNWIYTEGLYRKGGAAAKIRDLISAINTDQQSVDLGEYHVHVLTSVIKRFLQEMPEPLFTYDFYDDVIIVTEITNERERVSGLYSIIEKLPQSHHDLLQRLVFHLAKVALNEEYNKMSANALAIIFAPTILKTDRPQSAQDSLNVVSKQSLCVQTIIEEQMHKLQHVLQDINTLDTVTASATSRLMEVRASMQAHDKTPPEAISRPSTMSDEQNEVQMLSEQIAMLEHRRETLTNQMTALENVWSSSEEDLITSNELCIPKEDSGCERYMACFQYPDNSSEDVCHLNRRRDALPYRQPCTPYKVKHQTKTLASTSDEDSDSDIPKRTGLVPPQLSTVGSEIIV